MKKRRLITALLAAVLALSSATVFADTLDENSTNSTENTVQTTQTVSEPSVYAQSAILVEAGTGKVLYSKEADKRMYPASTTKIMTALIFLEHFNKDDVITIGTEVNEVSLDSSKAGHIVGESITAENLVRGLMIPSGNDSAVVAACAVARKIKNDDSMGLTQCEQIFADLMNQKAEELGCTGTHFTNPHGYHEDNHYTTAADMAKIAAEGMKNELIKQIAAEKSYSGNSLGSQQIDGALTQDYNWTSHNLLITNSEYNYQYADGIKTGFTDEAGDSVVASATKDNVQLIAVIYNSEDPNRWLDAKNLFEYGFNNFGYYTLNKNGDSVYTADLVYNKSAGGNTLDLVIKDDITLFLSKTDVGTITTDLNVTNQDILYTKSDTDETSETITLKAPIDEGAEIGTITYKDANGNVLAETKVYSSRTVEKANIFMRVLYKIKDALTGFVSNLSIVKVAVVVVIIIAIIIIIKIFRNRRGGGYYSRPKYKYKRRRRF